MSSINVKNFKSVDLVEVGGRIDSTTAPALDEALKQLTDSGRTKLVIDLSGVEYLSSAGLRALVSALRECRSRFGDVKLASPSERVNEVLQLAGLDSLFEQYDDPTAAVGSY